MKHTDDHGNSVRGSTLLLNDDQDVYFLRSAMEVKKNAVLADKYLGFEALV